MRQSYRMYLGKIVELAPTQELHLVRPGEAAPRLIDAAELRA